MSFIASCSGGKDSIATLILAKEHGEPLDEVVYAEVMFDSETSGEIPEHADFIKTRVKPFVENVLGVRFTTVRGAKTYDDVFHHIICRGPHMGLTYGFIWGNKCALNRECKLRPIERYLRANYGEVSSYIGIAADEPKRLARLDGTSKISLLAKYNCTEADALRLCEKYNLLSPIYEKLNRNGCWFCPNASDVERRHMLENHPRLFERLIEWEHEPNLFHRRLTYRETPSEIKARLSA